MSGGRPSEPTDPTAPASDGPRPAQDALEPAPFARPSPASAPDGPVSGPLGGRIFTIEGRPAPGLYLIGWLLSGAGLATAFVGGLSEPPVRGILVLAGLLLLGLGFSSAAGYQLLARSNRPFGAYRGPSPLIVFGVLFVLANAVGLALLSVGIGDVGTVGGFVVGAGLLFAGYLVCVWLFVVRAGALGWADLGLPRRKRLGALIGDVGFGAAVMVPVTVIALIAGGVVAQLVDAEPPDVVPIPDQPLEFVAVFVAAAIAIPIGEELFFRGFALTAWWRDIGARGALIRSALFFTIVHVANITTTDFAEGSGQALVQSIVILPLGFVLGWLFIQRGLWAPIAAHITYNGSVLLLASVAQRIVPPPA